MGIVNLKKKLGCSDTNI